MEVDKIEKVEKESRDFELGEELAPEVVDQLFSMAFGSGVSKQILAQWSNQGIRFSSDPETHMGLVQHEGGPCGVLATIQAFILKYLLFDREDLSNKSLQSLGIGRYDRSPYAREDDLTSVTEDKKTRALVHSMVEILFMCGSRQRAVLATLDVPSHRSEDTSVDGPKHEMITKSLEGLSIESATDFQKVLRVKTYTSEASAIKRLTEELPVFQSRMGAMLFLISALLSRGLESIQADRDDPSLPLVTAPFGHASQEIVNLLLCGQAVPNVFDGRMDLGGGMFLKGIPTTVEVGFLTLLESLNFCKVGNHLKCPKWPIWVVGSESHYTVLFALNPSVQEENELEERESKIRKAFDAQDQSGGGGFISVEGFHQVLRETNINFPPAKLESLTGAGFIVWSEFWQALLDLDRSLGGFKDSSGLNGKKLFDVYHFNGIAKSVLNGNGALQRPRLCKLSVSVPPKWSQDEYMADVSSSSNQGAEVNQPEPSKHAPLVDCIRTRWPRAVCNWVGDAPSIV
ncbi:uncharacterized protein A4U43_C09F1560 [Asparagus officinalis]|uniref:ubiquitinyl hydrolase 1 n=2 Tax=Asparagus officinalis TaxID=4686 RepID=A0A5P1E4F9_ASPOF|nr:uncharacterized protein A4U43_C09F1560 [Asparagus officinalis]